MGHPSASRPRRQWRRFLRVLSTPRVPLDPLCLLPDPRPAHTGSTHGVHQRDHWGGTSPCTHARSSPRPVGSKSKRSCPYVVEPAGRATGSSSLPVFDLPPSPFPGPRHRHWPSHPTRVPFSTPSPPPPSLSVAAWRWPVPTVGARISPPSAPWSMAATSSATSTARGRIAFALLRPCRQRVPLPQSRRRPPQRQR